VDTAKYRALATLGRFSIFFNESKGIHYSTKLNVINNGEKAIRTGVVARAKEC
jgi:hypothetical protein